MFIYLYINHITSFIQIYSNTMFGYFIFLCIANITNGFLGGFHPQYSKSIIRIFRDFQDMKDIRYLIRPLYDNWKDNRETIEEYFNNQDHHLSTMFDDNNNEKYFKLPSLIVDGDASQQIPSSDASITTITDTDAHDDVVHSIFSKIEPIIQSHTHTLHTHHLITGHTETILNIVVFIVLFSLKNQRWKKITRDIVDEIELDIDNLDCDDDDDLCNL